MMPSKNGSSQGKDPVYLLFPSHTLDNQDWIPAFAGMTEKEMTGAQPRRRRRELGPGMKTNYKDTGFP